MLSYGDVQLVIRSFGDTIDIARIDGRDFNVVDSWLLEVKFQVVIAEQRAARVTVRPLEARSGDNQ